MWIRRARCGASVLALALGIASRALATPIPIDIFVEPAHVFQHGVHDPCVFADNACNDDPAGWPDPVSALGLSSTQDFTGTAWTTWLADVGSQFVLGFDVNDSSTSQMISEFGIFINGSSTPLYEFTSSGTVIPSESNGTGWADYLLAPGCTNAINVGNPNFMNCGATDLMPFTLPAGTTSVQFTLSFVNNDGPDTIFAIPCTGDNCGLTAAAVPEPASLLLLGTGLTGLAARYRRRRLNRRG